MHRLEARAAAKNGRGNGALQKLGAVQECRLRKSFQKNGEYLDQFLYAVVDVDWRAMRAPMAAATVRIQYSAASRLQRAWPHVRSGPFNEWNSLSSS